MTTAPWTKYLEAYDDRRDLVLPGDRESTIEFSVDHFIYLAQESIADQGYFAVALSGGQTPKAIFNHLSEAPYRDLVDWSRVLAFWSDERCVPPTHADSNYNMAMAAGLKNVPLPPSNVFRMHGQGDPEENAEKYDQLIRKKIPRKTFDLVMLGLGEDGHTASLFPKTHALHSEGRVAVANYIPKKSNWRLTLTFDCINQSRNIAIYILGKQKASIVEAALTADYDPDQYPIQKVGTPTQKALWILDDDAYSELETVRQ